MNRAKHLLLVPCSLCCLYRGFLGSSLEQFGVFSMICDSKEGKVTTVCVTWIAQSFSPGRPWFPNF